MTSLGGRDETFSTPDGRSLSVRANGAAAATLNSLF